MGLNCEKEPVGLRPVLISIATPLTLLIEKQFHWLSADIFYPLK